MGNGRPFEPCNHWRKSPAIAHNELVASARVVAFDVPERDFPGNRSPARRKFADRQKEKSARKRRGALPATTMSLP
jgi:hypothetical protein